MSILTSAEIAEIARLNAARTPGEWRILPHPVMREADYGVMPDGINTWNSLCAVCHARRDDAAFIASCSVIVPKMLATIQALLDALPNPKVLRRMAGAYPSGTLAEWADHIEALAMQMEGEDEQT